MSNKKLDDLILQLENYLECWKQFNHFISLARAKKSSPDEEAQFLETKTVIIQELELILAAVECSSPSREEVHALVSNAPSIRYISELNEGSLRGLENQWHKIYIGWQSILGQLKAKQRTSESRSIFSFKRKS
jgi:hypothetical protein